MKNVSIFLLGILTAFAVHTSSHAQLVLTPQHTGERVQAQPHLQMMNDTLPVRLIWTLQHPEKHTCNSLMVTNDNRYVLGGSWRSSSLFSSAVVVGISDTGTELFHTSNSGGFADVVFRSCETVDGGIFAVGKMADGNFIRGGLFLRLDKTGTRLWEKHVMRDQFGLGIFVNDLEFKDVLPEPDGTFIVAGTSDYSEGACLMKVDAAGNEKWKYLDYMGKSTAVCVAALPDGDYLMFDTIIPSGQSLSILIERISATGRYIDGKTISANNASLSVTGACPTNDGKIIITGTYTPTGGASRMMALKYDYTAKAEVFFNSYGRGIQDSGGDIIQDEGTGYYCLGTAKKSKSGEAVLRLLHIDAKGDSLSEQFFLGKGPDYARQMQYDRNGNLLLSGTTNGSFGATKEDMFLIKLRTPITGITDDPAQIEKCCLTVSPNPAVDYLTVRTDVPAMQSARIMLHNMLGRLVAVHEIPRARTGTQVVHNFDITGMPAGTYFCMLHTGQTVRTQPFVILGR